MIYSKFALVIVEGGQKALRKFKRLMLNRVDWNSNPPPIVKEGEEPPPPIPELDGPNTCFLVWEGAVPQRGFRRWGIETCPTEGHAKQFLKIHNAGHYWDHAINFDESIAEAQHLTSV